MANELIYGVNLYKTNFFVCKLDYWEVYAKRKVTTIQTDEVGSKLHNVIVVGYGNDVYIAWDTSKGQYITLMPNDLTLKYCVGIKK